MVVFIDTVERLEEKSVFQKEIGKEVKVEVKMLRTSASESTRLVALVMIVAILALNISRKAPGPDLLM